MMYFLLSLLATSITTAPLQEVAVETRITPEFIQHFNPILVDIMSQVILKADLPFPDQKYFVPAVGTVSTHTRHVKCHNFKIHNQPLPGLFFSDGAIGLQLDFNLDCRTEITTNMRLIPSFAVNISLTGSNIYSTLALNYNPTKKTISPVLKQLNVRFKSVSVKMDNNPIVNFITNAFNNLLPPIASVFFKDMVRRLLPGIVKSGLDMRFSIPDGTGNEISFHNKFVAKPIITRQGARLKVAATSDTSSSFDVLIDETLSKPKSSPKLDPWNPFDLPGYMDSMWETGSAKKGLGLPMAGTSQGGNEDDTFGVPDSKNDSDEPSKVETDEHDSGYESNWSHSNGYDSGYESSSAPSKFMSDNAKKSIHKKLDIQKESYNANSVKQEDTKSSKGHGPNRMSKSPLENKK